MKADSVANSLRMMSAPSTRREPIRAGNKARLPISIFTNNVRVYQDKVGHLEYLIALTKAFTEGASSLWTQASIVLVGPFLM